MSELEVVLPTVYQQFIHKSRYARWNEQANRRETWEETVDRYVDFFQSKIINTQPNMSPFDEVWDDIRNSILNLEVMPSMRALMTAGKALAKNEMSGYNCAYTVIDSLRAFDEIMFVLMSGTGMGFSVERQYVSQLPIISESMVNTDTTITVHDSKIGWAKAYRELIALLWAGQIPKWDLSQVRPAGARLKTFGGRASGPGPLESLFQFTVHTIKNAAGRKLSSLECHDVVCKIGEVVVSGGVRRSALISLSNPSDDRMRVAKSGAWWENNSQRALANNSASYTEKPSFEVFMKEWLSLYESKSGERGIFSRVAAQKVASRNGRRSSDHDFGTNPCSEIILRPNQTCNLSEVVVRCDDTLETLKEKVRIATIIGTFQSTLTNFKYLRNIWKKNIEEERLLGVSLTGIMDNRELINLSFIQECMPILQRVAIDTNELWAKKLGIPQSTATTCIKPSGTVSQLVNSASGIHPRYSDYYIRRVRVDAKDPLAKFMIDKTVPCEPDIMNQNTLVFSFPMKAPEGAITRDTFTAMEQLKLWEAYQDHWCEHKPSITVYYKDSEFMECGQWVYNNFDKVSGISFLPHSDHTYQQAPYEEITKERYEELLKAIPIYINWDELADYEKEDNTTGTQELACTGGQCEI